MIGTATAALSGFSRAAWPPNEKIPTLYPVFPRFRVGIASCVRGLLGIAGSVPALAPRGSAAPVSTAAAAAVVPFKNARRSWFVLITSLSLQGNKPFYHTRITPRLARRSRPHYFGNPPKNRRGMASRHPPH